MDSAAATRAPYQRVAVCTADKDFALKSWDELTDDLLPSTHLVLPDELLVDADANAPAGWEEQRNDGRGDVRLYRRAGDAAAAPYQPTSGVPVMTALGPGVQPNAVFCSQALRASAQNDAIPFQVAPRYQGRWAEEARPAEQPEGTVAPMGEEPRRIRIGIVDTGLAPRGFLGPWLRPCIGHADETNADAPDPDGNGEVESPAGHGTFVAGVVAQCEPAVELYIAHAVDRQGTVSDLELAKAIDRLLDEAEGPLDIINLSLGAWTWKDQPPRLVGRQIDALCPETLVVAAAGNLGQERPFWPAAMDRVIGVAAVVRDGNDWAPAEYTNRGPWIKAVASDGGRRVAGARSTGHQVSTFFTDFPSASSPKFTGWAAWRGTSFTAPKVTGRIATVMLEHATDAPQAWEHLKRISPSAASAGFAEDAILVEDSPANASAAYT